MKFISCDRLHNFRCLVNAIFNAIECTWRFKKVYLIIFAARVLIGFKKFKTFRELWPFYVQFFKRPCLFVFIFTFIARYLVCLGIKKNITYKHYIPFIAFGTPLSIFFDKAQRAKELGIFTFGEVVLSLLKYIEYKKPSTISAIETLKVK